MIDIDFIPQWYQVRRSHRLWYQRQILILCTVALMVALWCVVAGRGLSKARAETTSAYVDFESEIGKIQYYERLQLQYTNLEAKSRIVESIKPRTPCTAVLAELSHCVGPDIVMKKLSFQSEPIESSSREGATVSVGRARRSVAAEADKTTGQLPLTQTRVVLVGYAANAQGVAALISSLEQSVYFSNVTPVYSKNGTMNKRDAAEFEIQCVLADFKISGGKG